MTSIAKVLWFCWAIQASGLYSYVTLVLSSLEIAIKSCSWLKTHLGHVASLGSAQQKNSKTLADSTKWEQLPEPSVITSIDWSIDRSIEEEVLLKNNSPCQAFSYTTLAGVFCWGFSASVDGNGRCSLDPVQEDTPKNGPIDNQVPYSKPSNLQRLH